MIDLLRLLISGYRAEIERADDIALQALKTDARSVSEIRQSLSSLVIAESALNKIALCEKFPDHPRQVVVIGPTQVGKSSMVNLLLNRELAQASAVAGFTVHCQGYAIGSAAADSGWSGHYYNDLESRAQPSLDRMILDEYSLTALTDAAESDRFDRTVFWDTPDFDSVDSYGYRVPVLKAIALADLIVFVVSRDKYADKTVWDMLTRLAELRKPMLIVMNKTPVEHRAALSESVRSKFGRLNIENTEGLQPQLHFIDEYQGGPAAAMAAPETEKIRVAIETSLQRSDMALLQSNVNHFMSLHWSDWTASTVNEHRLQMEWKAIVDEIAQVLVQRYRSEYFEGKRHKETFQLALAELLALLEVPGMAEPLSRIRSVVTWPMRKLIEKATDASSDSDLKKDDRTEERRLLEELGEHGLSRLAVRLSEQPLDQQWWAALSNKLESDKSHLLDGYHSGLDNYQVLLQVEIERAAQSLYKSLEQQPTTLNGLRAARVTADAAAVVLAVKSGGLGAADLVIAPAMLSLTSILTEGALGQYMQKVQHDLYVYQEKEVAGIIGRKLRVRLYRLTTESGSMAKVSQSQLIEATDKLGLELPTTATNDPTRIDHAEVSDV